MTDTGQLNRSAAYASIAVAALLLALKAWAVWTTGSTSMLGSLADTALDLIASLATLLGVWVPRSLLTITTASVMTRLRLWRRCFRWC